MGKGPTGLPKGKNPATDSINPTTAIISKSLFSLDTKSTFVKLLIFTMFYSKNTKKGD